MPRSPEDPVPDPLVSLVVVLAVQVGRHAGVEPPARAVVGAAVSRGVHVIVVVGRGEELLVVVEVLVEVEGVPGSPAATTPHQLMHILHHDSPTFDPEPLPVSADR